MPCASGIIASSYYDPPDLNTWLDNTNSTASASSNASTSVYPFNTSLSLEGSASNTSWTATSPSNQRIINTLPASIFFNMIKIVNFHNSLQNNTNGIKNIKIYSFLTNNSNYKADLKAATLLYSGPVRINNYTKNGANYSIIKLNVDIVVSTLIGIDIENNYGGSVMGVRRIQYGISPNPAVIKKSVVFDANINVLNSNQQPVPLNGSIYEWRSTDGVHSIDTSSLGNNTYVNYNNYLGIKNSNEGSISQAMQGLNYINYWVIMVMTMYLPVPNKGRIFQFFNTCRSNNDFVNLYFTQTSGTQISLEGYTRIGSNTKYVPTILHTGIVNDVRNVFAFCVKDTNDKISLDYIVPGSNTISNIVVGDSKYSVTSPTQWNPLYMEMTRQAASYIVHELSFNDATDSTILSKIASLRTKWAAN